MPISDRLAWPIRRKEKFVDIPRARVSFIPTREELGMPGNASPAIAEEQVAQSLVIVVPRAKLDLCESLSTSFGDDAKVQVILDRRFIDRRVRVDRREPEQRSRDRRLRSDMDAELRAGRWIVVPRASEQIDFLDPDTQAILFLCCSHHVVPCQKCQNTYRLSWIPRVDRGLYPCPLCGNDLTPTVVAHAQTCRYWVNRGTGAKEPRPQAERLAGVSRKPTG